MLDGDKPENKEKTEEQLQKEAKEKKAQKEKEDKEQARRDKERLSIANTRLKYKREYGKEILEFEMVESIRESKGEYDLASITDLDPKKPDPQQIYLDGDANELQYAVVGLDKKLKKGTIPWDQLQLPKNFPRDPAEIMQLKDPEKDEFLSALLEHTSKAGHTPRNPHAIQEKRREVLPMLASEEVPPGTVAEIGSGEESLVSLLQAGIYILPEEIRKFPARNVPEYKFEVTEGGKITGVDLDKFGRFGHANFDHKRYCKAIFALHALRGDKVVTVDWPDVMYISEAKLREAAEAALKEGIEIKWGPKVTDYLNNNIKYKHSLGLREEQSGKTFFEKEYLDEDGKRARKAEFEDLANQTAEKRMKQEEKLAPYLDADNVRNYDEENKRDRVKMEGKDSLIDKTTGDVDATKAKKFQDELDATTKGASADEEKKEKLEKVQKELESVQASLKELKSAEEKLDEQHHFYTKKIADAGNDTLKLQAAEKLLGQSGGERETARNGLIDVSEKKHKDLTTRVNILTTQLKILKPPVPTVVDSKPTKEQKRYDEMSKDLEETNKTLKESKCAKPAELKKSFKELDGKIQEKIQSVPKTAGPGS